MEINAIDRREEPITITEKRELQTRVYKDVGRF